MFAKTPTLILIISKRGFLMALSYGISIKTSENVPLLGYKWELSFNNFLIKLNGIFLLC